MQKKIILFIIIIFILSSAYLLAIGNKFNNLNFGKNWWAVYFVDPKSNSLDFVIENHSADSDFRWIILVEKEKINEGDIKIASGQSATIQSPLGGLSADGNKKITIEVSTGKNDKKEIYKNL